MSTFVPIVEPLPPELTPEELLRRLGDLPGACLLESSARGGPLGRYSFFAADPYDVFRLDRPQADPLAGLARRLATVPRQASIPGLPPMQGGAMGMLSYDLGGCFERLPRPRHDEFGYPLAWVGFYDCVFSWDHASGGGWLISQGFPEVEEAARTRRARERCDFFRDRLKRPPEEAADDQPRSARAAAFGCTAPQFTTRLPHEWIGSFDSGGFREAVERVRRYIAAGDVFQVNLAQRLMRPASCGPRRLYRSLRRRSPAPFAGFLDAGDFQIISSSPERFLKLTADRRVESRPIKGTRPRGRDAAQDASLAEELRLSAKDRAENTMIVDLLRNDLSRVCEPDSIRVPQLCGVESHPQVHHMVSVIEGRLRAGLDATDLIAATFPGGSITGAPKVRAMEIIAELEPTARGPYCGCLGYLAADGGSDWNILIRTILAKDGWWQFNVGGGVVYASDPAAEEEETWTKAAGMVAAVGSLEEEA